MHLLLIFLVLGQFSLSQNQVYHLVNQNMSWSVAQCYCRKHHTDLASVNDMKDLKNLKAAANGRTDAWIGLYTSDNLTDRKWHWSQPTVRYKERNDTWGQGQPNNGVDGNNCGTMHSDGKWHDFYCHDKLSCFFCYNESSNTTVMINDTTNRRTWLEAQQFCRTNHSDLMSGLDQHKRFQEQNQQEHCWIGLFRDTWSWSDGSNSSFRNWNNGQSIYSNRKKCVALEAEGRWKSDNCDQQKSFICERSSFVLVKENKTWEEALIHCRTNYRDLAWSIDIKSLKQEARAAIRDANSEFVWIGLHFACFFEAWVWVDGNYVPETNNNWKERGGSECGHVAAVEREEGKWVKKNFMDKYNFICMRH